MNILHPVSILYGDWHHKFQSLWSDQLTAIERRFGASVVRIQRPMVDLVDVPVIHVVLEKWFELVGFLKSQEGGHYSFLVDYTASDEAPREARFDLILNLLCHDNFSRIRVKTAVSELHKAPTLIPLWLGANWAEREIWDMFGVQFEGHPDLRRIIMDERWDGHPLRKDYPLRRYQIFPTAEPIESRLLEESGK